MRRILSGLSALLVAGALALGGELPACVAKLEDNEGHFANFQGELENVLAALLAMMAAPPTKSLPDYAHLWVDAVSEQEQRFDELGENVVDAYKAAYPKRTIRTIADLPPAYNSAINEWRGKWNWLAGDGFQVYYRIKWLQLQTAYNKDYNTPMGKRMWFWLQQNTGILESALFGAAQEIPRRDQRAFGQRIKIAKDCRQATRLITDVYSNHKSAYEKYFGDCSPDKLGGFLPWFESWGVTKDEWPTFNKLKVAWIAILTALAADYARSYGEVVKVWKPVLDQDFLEVGRQYTKGFSVRELRRNYETAILKLEREMAAAMKK
jgi:hypothetical protein